MYYITAFYKFTSISPIRLGVLQDECSAFCSGRDIRGLLLLGTEGCNGTLSGSEHAISELKAYLCTVPEFGTMTYRDSRSERPPFKRMKVDIRNEIVTLGRPDVRPEGVANNHLTPEEWHRTIESGENVYLLDTRNAYETEIGMFRGAVDPGLENFADFPEFLRSSGISKDQKVLMYCTGGIRCEKALLFMQQEGFKNVFQLEGGILNYLERYRGGFWEGECFVFDHRVAVDGSLRASEKYRLCPHCGNPAKEEIDCVNCGNAAIICHRCLNGRARTCSKNCAYHAAA